MSQAASSPISVARAECAHLESRRREGAGTDIAAQLNGTERSHSRQKEYPPMASYPPSRMSYARQRPKGCAALVISY